MAKSFSNDVATTNRAYQMPSEKNRSTSFTFVIFHSYRHKDSYFNTYLNMSIFNSLNDDNIGGFVKAHTVLKKS